MLKIDGKLDNIPVHRSDDHQRFVIKSHRTGSNYICDPPVLDTDIDTLVLVSNLVFYRDALFHDGWNVHGDYHKEADFANNLYSDYAFLTARKGKENIIAYANEVGYERFLTATLICKAFNMTDKADRVKAHVVACDREPKNVQGI